MAELHHTIEELSFAEVIGDRFGRYSKYIIQDRALPDVRDGLKPVQRRILYAMYQDRNTADKAYRKSAKTVGNVIGNYHPHGDSSVYEAMVRMSQDWKNLHPLIDMHGNNGSMDGDSAAAMRYTEARLSKIAQELLEDIQYDTVDHTLNFDDTFEEPEVLPAGFPNLLVNGATGISAGYATEIPPHNLNEVLEALIYMLNHSTYELKKLMSFIKGPDFPTGGIIQGAENLEDIYEKGRGKIVIRSKVEIEKLRGDKTQLVATEIPFDVNKAKLIQKIDDIRLQRKIEGIVEVRDESDRTGIRLVIELRKNVDTEGILNYLFLNTDLQRNYHFNMTAIHDHRPELMGLVSILEAYLEHQREVVLRRTRYKLNTDQERLHIVDGLIHMLSILDEVIATIRRSESKADAKDNLQTEFEFSEPQAEAIVSLQLYRLTNTDITALQNERLELNERIMMYQSILKDEKTLKHVISDELKKIQKTYKKNRLTEIEDEIETIEVEQTLLVPSEQVIVSVTRQGYIKKTSTRSFNSSDTLDMALRDFDYELFVQEMNSHDAIVMLTNKGNYIYLPVHELPDVRWKDYGMHISQTYDLEDNETIIFVTQAAEGIEGRESRRQPDVNLLIATKEGRLKQTALSDFVTYRSYKTRTQRAIKLRTASDEVVAVQEVHENTDTEVILLTNNSYSLMFPLEEVSKYGLNAQGVIGINLKKGDHLASCLVHSAADKNDQILILTQRGNVKRFGVDILATAARGSRGIQVLRELKAQPHRIIAALMLHAGNTPVIVKGDTGYDAKVYSHDIPLTERLNNGSALSENKELGQVLTMHKARLTLIDKAD